MDAVPGYVRVNEQETMSQADRDRILIAQDAHRNRKRETLMLERQHLRREREAFQQQTEQREAAQRQEMQAAREVKGSPGPAQARHMIEHQDRIIDELKSIMTAFTIDVKSSVESLSHAQRGNEIGITQFRAELRKLEGGITQVVTKSQELESAIEGWTDPDGLGTWSEEEDDDDWNDGKGGEDYDDDDDGAPDGAAKGKR